MKPLAILGGKPAFENPLHVGCPNVGNQEQFFRRAKEAFARRWLTNNGPLVQEFERRLADFLGVKHCICVSNGTAGLGIAIRAAGMAREVIVPSFTFVATAHALQWQQITPVFCDVDPVTHNLDPRKVERLITPRCTGILGVHLWGRPCAIEALTDIARRHGLRLLFDAAHAFGCSQAGKMIGHFGDAEVFSFHATKFFNSLEGGAIVTNDDALAEQSRRMRNFGLDGPDRVAQVGVNGKMSEMCAAMGLTNLESIEDFIRVNKNNYEQYRTNLDGTPGLKLLAHGSGEKRNFQHVVLEVDGSEAGLTRDELVESLQAENVLARRYFYPGCHRMQPYASMDPEAGRRLVATERLAASVMALPTGTAVTSEAVDTICGIIRNALANARQVRRRLAQRQPGGRSVNMADESCDGSMAARSGLPGANRAWETSMKS